ncbi:MAG: polysaccharide deacetylase family protein [Thermomicrobiales bacterium]
MRASLALLRFVAAGWLALAAVVLARPARAGAVTPVYFAQTGHALGAHFTLFWRQHGGVATFGYPLSEEFTETGRTTQYFERAVLQWFPENAGSPYAVQGVQLGRDLTAGRESEPPFAPLPSQASSPSIFYFAETGHTLRGAFAQTWLTGGGLAVFGFPLSEEFVEVNAADGQPYLTQYFERVRLEYHPEVVGTPDAVTRGLLGWQRATARELFGTPSFAPQPAPPASARTIGRLDTQQPLIALTFDAGADRGFTSQILDILAANGITATFGITGVWAQANPDLVRRIGAAGHQVINHTLDHRSFTGVSDGLGGLSPDARVAELEQADAIIAPLLGHTTRPWFRPPYGDYDAAALAQVAAAGYGYNVLWTIDTLGWQGASTSAIVDRVMQGAGPGAIVLMHVGAASRDTAALQPMIDDLRARGYGCTTVAAVVTP